MKIDVRPVADASVLQDLGEILGQAFAFDPAQAGRWFERAGTHQLRVAHGERGDVVGGLLRIPMGQSCGGRMVPLVGLAGVGVRADVRRRGVATELLRRTLRELREHGVALSGLYASNPPLYRAAGWEQAGARYLGTLRPRDIDVPSEPAVGVSVARPEDHAEVAALYQDHALFRPGFLDRGPYVWDRIRQPFDGGRVHGSLLREQGGALDAYVSYRMDRLPDGGQRLDVVDVASRSPRGWSRVWSHLRDLCTMVSEVRLVTAPTDPLHLVLQHPAVRMTLHEPYYLRVVDPKAALEARGYARGQNERLVLRVVDPLFGDETLTVDVEGGRAEVRTGGDPTAHLHVRGLAGMFTGHLSPHEAQAAGLIDAGPRSLAALQALFAGPAPWMRDFF